MKMKELVLSFMMIFASLGAGAQVLYKVSGNGAKGDSYLMGTHHFAPSKMLKDIKGFDAALDGVEAVYGEIDEKDADLSAIEKLTKELAVAPADSSISKILTADEYQLLDQIVKKYTNNTVGAKELESVKATPAIIEMQIAAMQALQAFPDFSANDQIDLKIQKKAKKLKKSTGGLESPEKQVRLLFGSPISLQAESLKRMMSQDMYALLLSKRLAELYTSQDLDGLWALMNDPMLGSTPAETERLIYSRNDDWMTRIPSLIAEKPIMFVVGAGHLPGERGLIAQLKKAGYEVTPVK